MVHCRPERACVCIMSSTDEYYYERVHQPELLNKLFKMYKQVLTQRIKVLKTTSLSPVLSSYQHHQNKCFIQILTLVRNYNSPVYRKRKTNNDQYACSKYTRIN